MSTACYSIVILLQATGCIYTSNSKPSTTTCKDYSIQYSVYLSVTVVQITCKSKFRYCRVLYDIVICGFLLKMFRSKDMVKSALRHCL